MSDGLSRLTAVLRNNRRLKITALAIAVFTWYSVRRATSYETLVKDVPLTVLQREGWAVLDRSIGDVDVLFSGTLQDLRFLNRDQIQVLIDTQDIEGSGFSTHRVLPKNVQYQGGARVVRIEPDLVRLRLDREGDKTVPVRADVVGSPPEGVEVIKVECTPSSVVVHGPRQRMEKIDEIRSAPIDLEGRMRSFQLTRKLESPNPNWSIRLDPAEVRVAVTLVERRSSRTVTGVRVRPLLNADSTTPLRFEPDAVEVRLEGETAALARARTNEVLAFVDAAELAKGEARDLPVRISPPVGLRATLVEPATVKATSSHTGGGP